MVNCIVKSCKNRGKIPGITYHQIPKHYAKEWLNAINRKSNEIISHRNVVCSQHFKTEDFKGGKNICLKQGAVPSINLGDICSNLSNEFIPSNNDESVTDLSACEESALSEPEILTYTLSSKTNSALCPGSLKFITQSNQTVPAYELMYNYCSEKEKDPLGDEDLKEEPILMECSYSEKSEDSTEIPMKIINDEDLQKNQILNESSDSKKTESTEIQKKLIKEFHDYSLSPARYGRLAVRHTVNSIKKKLKAAQQKHRRLERRVMRLKDMLEKLKQKNV